MNEHRSGSGAQVAPSTALALQCCVSVAGTMVGEALGDTLVEKLAGGLLLCCIGAFLMAPGGHRRRRVVAVALLLGLFALLRRAGDALASSGRGRPARSGGAFMPASWVAVGFATVVGFGLGSLGTAAIDGWASTSAPAFASVPAVAGKSSAAARATLEQAGFESVRARTPSTSVPRGLAIGTSPARGATVRRGSSIKLFVSSGPPRRRLSIPDVRGLPEREARTLLEQAGLSTRRADAPSALIDEGLATGTSPAAGERVRGGSRVTLFISSGSPGRRVSIPPVRGLPERDARALIEDLGLRVERREASSEEIARGAATGSLPPAGTRVSAGSRVTLLVSTRAPESERVVVPDVTDLPEGTALARLRAAGLDVTSRSMPSDEIRTGRAIATDPGAGDRVKRGARVKLLVSSGSRVERVEVPRLVGDPIEQANDRLDAVGLRADRVEHDSSEPAGTVLRSDPASGSSVVVGSTVRLHVSSGTLVRVPDVVGQTADEAKVALTDLGLNPVFTGVDSELPGNTVTSTDPAAGDEVARGSRVEVSYSVVVD